MTSRRQGLFVASGVIGGVIALALLGTVEVSLRLAGFHRDAAPIALRFGYPNPREIVGFFRPDPQLFWRMTPGSVFDAEAAVPINARGYRGALPATPRPAGSLRVAVMGDSVAFGTATAFPEMLSARLSERLAPRPVEVLDFGVPGYTIVQGLRQFGSDVAPLRPDVVVIAYGWNDHWLARAGLPDSRLTPPGPIATRVALLVSRLRIAQAMRALIERADVASGTARRVPVEEFGALVGRLAAAARAAGARPVVLGLPSALTGETVPEYLTVGRFTPSAEDAVRDHALWLAAARKAAEDAGAAWVDPGPAFENGGGVDPGLFTKDRIHLSERGNGLIAGLLVDPVAAAAPP